MKFRLGVGTSAISHSIRGLEERLGVRLRAALDGVGLAYALEEHAAEHIARGRLVRVLADWCPPFDGFFLYYPSRRHQPAALQALVDALRV